MASSSGGPGKCLRLPDFLESERGSLRTEPRHVSGHASNQQAKLQRWNYTGGMNSGYGASRLTVENVKLAREWHRDDLVPDVLDHRDTFAAPAAVVHAVEERYRRTGSAIASLIRVDYPKGRSGARPMPLWDPLALHAYRGALTPIVSNLNRGLPTSVVSRRVLLGRSGCWSAEPWRKARTRFRQEIGAWRLANPDGGRGVLDVRSAFATIDLDVLLGTTLPSIGCDEAQLGALRRIFGELHDWPGRWSGLLQGLEPSSLLGTAALLPIDRLLARREMQHVRWVDDGVIASDSAGEFLDIAGEIDALLQSSLGQALNPAKTDWQPWKAEMKLNTSMGAGHEREDLFDPLLDYRKPLVVLADAEEHGNPDGVGGALTRLAEQESLEGHSFIRRNPWALASLPRECATHITHRNVWPRITAADKSDWMTMCEPDSGSAKLFRLHLMHVLRSELSNHLSWEVASDEGMRLQAGDGADCALGLEYLAVAGNAARSKGSISELFELASAHPETNAQRALLGAQQRGSLSRARRRDLSECARRSPVLMPLAASLGAD